MPEVPLKFSGWRRGLYVSGAREFAPEDSLRRARGIHAVTTGTIRSRDGSTLVQSFEPHSIFRFNDKRYYGVGTDLYEDSSVIQSGLSGSRLRAARMPVVPNGSDYLFVAGGGTLIKVDSSGNVTNWGIDAPANGMTAAKASLLTKTIELFEGDTPGDPAADFTTGSSPINATLANEGTQVIEGSYSLKATVAASTEAKFWRAFSSTLDLTEYASGPTVAPDEDFIKFDVFIDKPGYVDYIKVIFDVSTGGFDGTTGDTTDAYVVTAEAISEAIGHAGQINGLADLEEDGVIDAANIVQFTRESPNPLEFGTVEEDLPDTRVISANRRRHYLRETGTTTIDSNAPPRWFRFRIPKELFTRSGDGSKTWSETEGVQFVVKTNSGGQVIMFFDAMNLQGGAGMLGDYKYLYSFMNSTTGHFSNPNATPVVVTSVDRQGVNLSSIPTTSSDSQVDTVRIWRTLGGGAVYFKLVDLPLGTSTYADLIADYWGMDSRYTDETVLSSVRMRRDMDVPGSDIIDVVGLHAGRAWTLNGTDGLLYYSPPGYPEGSAGFVELSEADTPTKRAVIWNGNLYAFTEAHVYLITGTSEPFIPVEISGAPGTIKPGTVVATPMGVLYEADDGLRVMDGSSSRLLYPEAIQPLFRGDGVAGMLSFDGVEAAYGRDSYLITDETETLSVSKDGTWRALGVGCSAINFEEDTEEFIAGIDGKTLILEDEGTLDDDGVPIDFEVETQGQKLDEDQQGLLKRINIIADTSGETITPTLILDEQELALPPFVAPVKSLITYKVERPGRIFGLRLSGLLSGRVEISEIVGRMYIGGQ